MGYTVQNFAEGDLVRLRCHTLSQDALGEAIKPSSSYILVHMDDLALPRKPGTPEVARLA
jgi:hypothetical protein